MARDKSGGGKHRGGGGNDSGSGGDGRHRQQPSKCPGCSGSGKVAVTTDGDGSEKTTVMENCGTCGGRGTV
jgi:hypothetical protein